MRILLLYRSFVVAVGLIACCATVAAAQDMLAVSNKTPYYINVNTARESDVYTIQEGLLHIQYNDSYGQQKDIKLTVKNWKLEPVGSFVLDKAFGLNQYTVALKDRIPGFESGTNYFCRIEDEGGHVYEWVFRDITPLKSKDFTIDVVVNPRHVSCKPMEANNVEFYGDIKKGKAPYIVRWFVLNENRTDFMYQPKEENITSDGQTSVLMVDKTPAYYVVLDVTDACGTNARKVVLMQCRENKKKVNTIFVDPSLIYNNSTLRPIR